MYHPRRGSGTRPRRGAYCSTYVLRTWIVGTHGERIGVELLPVLGLDSEVEGTEVRHTANRGSRGGEIRSLPEVGRHGLQVRV